MIDDACDLDAVFLVAINTIEIGATRKVLHTNSIVVRRVSSSVRQPYER